MLAILLLHAGEVVSSDRLIDELWGEDPPEDAQTALQQHVSRLRKQLEPHEVLLTQAPGYVVTVESAELDLLRFRELRDGGRLEVDAGRDEDAADTYRAALDLWRGRPLADLENERFALAAVPGLEEERLDALGSRIDADLACGRHAEVVSELQSLVRAQPLRERFRAQLMLALYRSGRQSEALDVYADARRTFVGELGLEPGPELQRTQQAILAHDPALDPPPMRRPAGRRRGRRLGLLAAAVVAALVVVAAVFAVTRDEVDAGLAASADESHVVAVDAATGEVRRRIPAGRTPSALAARAGSVWIVDADAQTVLQVAEDARAIETFSTGATPTDVAAGADAVWVVNGRPLRSAQFVGPVGTSVVRIDPTTRTERAEVPLPRRVGAVSNLVANHVAVSRDAVWVVTPDYGVARLNASTGAVTGVSRAIRASAVASGRAGVWALGIDGTVALLDERSGRPKAQTRIPATSVTSIAVGEDAAWVTSGTDGTLWRVSGGRGPVLGSVDVGRGVTDVAAGLDSVWVTNPLAGTLTEIDAATVTPERTVELQGVPDSVAVDGDTVWVSVVAGPSAAATNEVSGVQALPSTACEPVVAGKGESDLLVVSDLPLQGGIRITATQMAQAIAFTLREREFRAGRFRVAYQSCDDSIARTGLYDEAKCAANARAYADNADVVGVIGTLNSPCALAAVPVLNTAEGGALGMVSPLNSFVGLTREGVGIPPSLPSSLYPTGRRNYLRVYPTDDLQGAALALRAKDLGAKRVFVLDDDEPGYGELMATGFETAARRLGLDVAGRSSWNPQARSYDALTERVARSGASAVFVGGLLDSNVAQVIQDLRERLGKDVAILGPGRAHAAPPPRRAGRGGGAWRVREPPGRRHRTVASGRVRLRRAFWSHSRWCAGRACRCVRGAGGGRASRCDRAIGRNA